MNHFVEKINLKSENQVKELELFLKKFHLKLGANIDFSLVIRDNHSNIIGTCSKSYNILKGFAINKTIQGENLTNLLLIAMQNQLFKENVYHSYIYTKPIYSLIFKELGYNLISTVKGVCLLESGFSNISKYLKKIKNQYNIDPSIAKASLVMNCNPFTLGHRYLIEEASWNSKEVLVFIVEENKSIFPFSHRFNLVKKGVEDLANVTVIPGGEYIISQATFPSYFIKEQKEVENIFTELDASIFADYFCKEFNITKRYLGKEPYCHTTNKYNDSLYKILKAKNIDVKIIDRLSTSNSSTDFISASKIRASIKSHKVKSNPYLERSLPKITIDYLNSKEGKEVVDKICNS